MDCNFKNLEEILSDINLVTLVSVFYSNGILNLHNLEIPCGKRSFWPLLVKVQLAAILEFLRSFHFAWHKLISNCLIMPDQHYIPYLFGYKMGVSPL